MTINIEQLLRKIGSLLIVAIMLVVVVLAATNPLVYWLLPPPAQACVITGIASKFDAQSAENRQKATDLLRANPDQAAGFDEMFGTGSAAKILGGKDIRRAS